MSSTVALFANCRPSGLAIQRLVSALTFAGLCFTTAVGRSPAQVATGDVKGTVFTTDPDGTRSPIPGSKVSLRGPGSLRETIADQQAGYHFSGLAPGIYQVEASAPGLSGSNAVTVTPGAVAEASIELQVALLKESVTVTASAEAPSSAESSEETTIGKTAIINAPNKSDRVDAVLPLIPGVVRGPDGLINMKGARSSQGGALINSANVTDPVTGNPAMTLPIDVVQSVKVVSDPYDPEYGRLTGAVSSVETATGNFDGFHVSVQNLLVRPRKRGGDFIGIESWTPRITLTGPVIKDKVAVTQSFEYRFVRTPVYSLPPLDRDTKFESVDSFTQVDANLTTRQSLTASFALYPQKLNYLGLNTFAPQPATPDLHQRGYMASLQHRDAIGADTLLVSQFSYKRFDVDLTANSSDPYELRLETTTGGFFDRQRRNSYRTEWQETFQFGARGLGSHQFKIGANFAHSTYDGRVDLLPVTIIGAADFPIERIGFGPASQFGVHQNELAWFAADSWKPFQRLTVDLGLRFDWDSVTASTHAAPRAGFAYLLTNDAKTILKGGAGLFYDRVPLNIASFPFLPGRIVTTLAPTGEALSSVGYANTIPSGLRNPRTVGWNVELDRELTSAWLVRGGYQQRNTARDFTLDPETIPGILALSNRGGSFYREIQVTTRYKIRRATVNASYVRSKAYGNLNYFNQFFGNDPVAVIEPDERGRLPFDAPNRFLAWAEWAAPFKLTLLPVLDVHTGFPWSRINQEREFVGPRDSERYPRFTSFDLQVTRPVKLPISHERLKSRIGFSVFNLFNQFNPRDVQSDIDSARYAALFNSVGRTFRGKFILDF
jgi:TonB dependent receptor/Carboxypeptidase regulatory-like domain